MHTEIMQKLVEAMNNSGDEELATLFFQTLFDKMHLSLNSIKIEKFRTAECNLEILKILLDHKIAQEVFTKSPNFLSPNLSGKQIQMETYFGRYLSFSCISQETKGWKD